MHEINTERCFYVCYTDEEIEVDTRVFCKVCSWSPAEMRCRSNPSYSEAFVPSVMSRFSRGQPSLLREIPPVVFSSRFLLTQMPRPHLWRCPLIGSGGGPWHLGFLTNAPGGCATQCDRILRTEGLGFYSHSPIGMPTLKHIPANTEREIR